ncbi:M28 family peptidase [Candidatus Cardinium hertigii]|uniref:M28 family peptidase n=1 Tax=Candidatus Cardinium hertigii TaxID=247481 RepID=UPI003D7C5672
MTIFKVYGIYQLYIATLLIGCNRTPLRILTTTNGVGAGTPINIDEDISNTTVSDRSDEVLSEHLKQHITYLSKTIGSRNIEDQEHYQKLSQAAKYIDDAFKEIGYQTNVMTYSATHNHQKFDVQNIEIVIPGSNSTSSECIVIGAHYDTVLASPGADDNGSGIAVLIEIARHMYNIYTQDNTKIKRTIKLVAFPNEECPYSVDEETGKHFCSNMGSVQYAKQVKARGDVITGMISLESISYFSNEPNSQIYPWYLKWLKYFYGDRGNFLMVIGDLKSREFQKKWMARYEQITPKPFPMHRVALPGWMPNVYRSDHGSFSLEGFSAFMITDTANLRNNNYHQATDKIETIDFNHFTQAAKSLIETVEGLVLDGRLKT